MKAGEIDHEGQKINIVVPTGNFGNILAAYYAMKMGLPVNKLICASNSNNVLTDFLKTGVYNRNRPFYTTVSPSMDILVSSNLERLLYDMTGGNSEKVKGWMNKLSTEGQYQVDSDVIDTLKKLFYSGCCDDETTKATIKETQETENYLCDTHTAVAINVYHQYIKETNDKETKTVIVSTASPYKFADSVLSAITDDYDKGEDDFAKISELSALSGTPIPQPIADLQEKAIRFQNICTVDRMSDAVLDFIR
jgi:threonine synthase